MIGGGPYPLDIGGAEAFLAGGDPPPAGRDLPQKMSLNWTIPAEVKSSVGSSGMRLAEGNLLCPFLSKKERYASLSSRLFMKAILAIRERICRPQLARSRFLCIVWLVVWR